MKNSLGWSSGIFRKSIASLLCAVAGMFVFAPQKGFPDGGEIGNGRFMKYTNILHGFILEHPSEWNIIELGNAVSVVEDPSEMSSQENAGSIALSFEESKKPLDKFSFERAVKKAHPSMNWERVSFDGRVAFRSQTANRMYFKILKDQATLVHLDYPVDARGEAEVLVERCLNSLHFQ